MFIVYYISIIFYLYVTWCWHENIWVLYGGCKRWMLWWQPLDRHQLQALHPRPGAILVFVPGLRAARLQCIAMPMLPGSPPGVPPCIFADIRGIICIIIFWSDQSVHCKWCQCLGYFVNQGPTASGFMTCFPQVLMTESEWLCFKGTFWPEEIKKTIRCICEDMGSTTGCCAQVGIIEGWSHLWSLWLH